MKALLLALLVLLVSGSAAFAQPLSDVATYTNWSLKNSVNPFYKDGRKGISYEEAARLPVGTLIALPDGTTHALKRGEYVWKLSRAYAVKVPLATRALPETPRVAAAPPAKTPKVATATPPAKAVKPAQTPAIDPMKDEYARIQARYQAERETARLSEEVSALRVTAEDGLAIATGSMTAAFAATSKGEALEQAESARSSADLVRKNADEAGRVAAEATRIANASDSDKAKKTALAVRADANATSIAAANARKVAERAAEAPKLWVTDWPPTLALVALGLVASYLLIPNILFNFLPGVFNFLFRGGINNDGLVNLGIKAFATPAMASFYLIDNEPFYQRHYPYLYATPETANALEEEDFIDAVEADPLPANDSRTLEEDRRFSVYPDDKRLEVHQVLH